MHVIVVGSGISGIAAARELSCKGVKVTVIEAQDRLGGRIHTVKLGDQKYDLGASWYHETLRNELFDMNVEQGIDAYYDDGVCKQYTRSGCLSSDLKIQRIAVDIAGEIALEYGQENPPADVPLLHKAVEIAESRPIISAHQQQLATRYLQFLELYHGLPWTEQSAAHSSLDDTYGRDLFVFGNETTYQRVFDQVNWANVTLLKNCPVQSIGNEETGSLTGLFRVRLQNDQVVEGTHLICTVPLGVLKSGGLFEFPLPGHLQMAISDLAFAALGKVVLEFDNRWWDNEPDRMFVLVDKPALAPASMNPGEFPVFFTNAYKNKATPALIALVAPPLTQLLEAHPDMAFEYLLPALEGIRKEPGKKVPSPSRIIVSDWTQNHYFRGSYCGLKAGTDPNVLLAFSKGFGNLRFAGEHTAVHGAGCMHGAYASGIREAKFILDSASSSGQGL